MPIDTNISDLLSYVHRQRHKNRRAIDEGLSLSLMLRLVSLVWPGCGSMLFWLHEMSRVTHIQVSVGSFCVVRGKVQRTYTHPIHTT